MESTRRKPMKSYTTHTKPNLAVAFRDTRLSLQESLLPSHHDPDDELPIQHNNAARTLSNRERRNSIFGLSMTCAKRRLSLDANVSSGNTRSLLVEYHMAFAHSFRENDAAKLAQFLDTDVKLTTVSGEVITGYTAVLGYFVAPEREKLCRQLRLKNLRANQSSENETKLLYKHGLVFHTPIYTEVIVWKENRLIQQIKHFNIPFNTAGKSPQQLLRLSSNTQPHSQRASIGKPFFKSRSDSVSTSKSTHSTEVFSLPPFTMHSVSFSDLPITKKRKGLQWNMHLRYLPSGLTYKSSTVKGASAPSWNDLKIDIPQHDHTIVITLFSKGFFVDTKVLSVNVSLHNVWQEKQGSLAFRVPVEVDVADDSGTLRHVRISAELGIKTCSKPLLDSANEVSTDNLDVEDVKTPVDHAKVVDWPPTHANVHQSVLDYGHFIFFAILCTLFTALWISRLYV